MNENEDIQILDVAGRLDPEDSYLHDTLFTMSLTSELTKSNKGLYHAQINPAYGDDAAMTTASWLQAADMLGQQLGLDEQRRVIVLHTKKGRTHAHVVWERYDLDKGRMISDSFSRLAQDRARKEMERVFEHAQTPHRNVRRPEMKEALSILWQKAKSGFDFLKEAGKAGYIIAKGVQRRPFMVVDETGRSFDLVRQLHGAKTKDVREKLKTEKLPLEKEAITTAKALNNAKALDAVQERALDKKENFSEQIKVDKEAKQASLVQSFAEARQHIIKPETLPSANKETGMKERAEKTAKAFDLSSNDITKTSNPVISEKERKQQEMRRQLKDQQERNIKSQDKDFERD